MKVIFQTKTGLACLEYKRTTNNYVVVVLPKDARYFPKDVRDFGAYYSDLKQELYVLINKVQGALYNTEDNNNLQHIDCVNSI